MTADWVGLSDDHLLDVRFCDLGLRIDGTWVEGCVQRLFRELEDRRIPFRPHVFVSSEWFSPERTASFAVPFYLLHPRLMRLERRQMFDIEGGSREDCMRHLRHECGHAIQHGYGFHRRKKWRELFGRSTQHYPEKYRPSPISRNFVHHLRLYYAQSHPDEDFAETFAVWLAPESDWRRKYADWPALTKLAYIDELTSELAGSGAPPADTREEEPLGQLERTLREHYEDRRSMPEGTVPEVQDGELRELFQSASEASDASGASGAPGPERRAAAFLRRERGRMRRVVARWTGDYQYTIDQVLDDMIHRCDQLDLRAEGDEEDLRLRFCVLLTAKTIHFHFSEQHWISM